MKYAIIEVGTKQYKVQEGQVVEVQKMDSRGEVVFDRVLLVVEGDNVTVGTPTVADMKVYATYVEDKKGIKLQVFKYKSKSKYRKMRGARQTYSYLKIDSIGTKPAAKAEKKVEKVTKEASVSAKAVTKKATTKKTPAKKAAK